MTKNKIISFYRIISYVILLLGIVHCALIPVFYSSLTHDAIFSFGTGLAVIFLSMLNIVAAKFLMPLLLTIALIANIMQTLYAGMSLLIMPEPPAYIGAFIFLLATLTCGVVRTEVTRAN